MPELPDVEVYRRRLAQATTHRRLVAVIVRDAGVLRSASGPRLGDELGGARVVSTRRHGKNLYVMTADGPHLRLHFGMTGALVVASGDDEARHTRVVFALSGGTRLLFVDQRKLGQVDLVASVTDDIRRLGLGPDALAVGRGDLAAVLRQSRSALKPTLMDQHKLAGLGNLYSDEILFQARLDPRGPAAAVDDHGVRRLHRQMRRVLERAIAGDVTDFPRGWLLHHRRDGAECPRRNGLVHRFSSAGRHGYYCPECQYEHGQPNGRPGPGQRLAPARTRT